MEPGFATSLTDRNSELRDIFEIKIIQAKEKKKKGETDDKTDDTDNSFKYVDRPVVRYIITIKCLVCYLLIMF